MCGIAGWVGAPPPDHETLSRMAQAMAHRGPDDQRVWSDVTCGLAFRRLAIIDLDPRSSQPIALGQLHLIFNGEIYNYVELRDELRARGRQFHTEGDGEVLLHAWDEWGTGALDRVNGMFALAVWDGLRRRLTLVSDPFGEKPLYYFQRGGCLVFGSDVRALMQAVPEIGSPDEQSLATFLAHGYAPSPDASFFAGVRRLPGAHMLCWEAGRSEIQRYWTPQTVRVPTKYAEATEEVRELLVDAIRLRLRSDVPVGTSLSGGVDSSAIVALSAALAGDHRRHAFTARFPGFERDEWPYAEAAGQAAGVIEHHAIEPTADQLFRDVESLVRDHEEPLGSTAIYAQWRVFQAAREAGVVVLLDGQGADELFGGYPGNVEEALSARGSRGIARAVAGSGPERRRIERRLATVPVTRWMLKRMGRQVSNPYTSGAVTAFRSEAAATGLLAGRDPLHRELLSEAFSSSLPVLLRYADRSSMAHSREVRLPFLDRRLAELALSMPSDFLYRDGVTKRILRDAARGVVPDIVLERRDKVAFEPPQASWLTSAAWRHQIGEILLDPRAHGRELYDHAAIAADLRAGVWRDHRSIWRVLSTELWLRAFSDSGT